MASRRNLLLAGVLGLCAAAGVWVGRRMNPPPADPGPERLPDIVLNDLSGTPRALSEWSGRTLLINFWATWCAPCRREMPLLQALQDGRDPERLRVIGIAIDRQDPVERFLAETGVNYPVLIGQQDAMLAAERFGSAFGALPFTVLVSPDGYILGMHTGELHAPDLEHWMGIADEVAEGRLPVPEARRRLAAWRPGS
ncbi:MAG: TlpA family protein disulfide reductase [Chromatiales bacterium]|nr:TlpA family protein disulfide reductase [Chromatiales bacterium]